MRKKTWCPVLGVAVLSVFLCGGILPAQGTPPAGKPAARGRRSIPQVRAARAMEAALKGLKGERRRSAPGPGPRKPRRRTRAGRPGPG